MKKERFKREVAIIIIHGLKGARYLISDSKTGTVIDDAQGYGFKSPEAVMNYAETKGWIVVNAPQEPKTIALF